MKRLAGGVGEAAVYRPSEEKTGEVKKKRWGKEGRKERKGKRKR